MVDSERPDQQEIELNLFSMGDIMSSPMFFSYAVPKRCAVEKINFHTFSIYVLGICKCNSNSPGTLCHGNRIDKRSLLLI